MRVHGLVYMGAGQAYAPLMVLDFYSWALQREGVYEREHAPDIVQQLQPYVAECGWSP